MKIGNNNLFTGNFSAAQKKNTVIFQTGTQESGNSSSMKRMLVQDRRNEQIKAGQMQSGTTGKHQATSANSVINDTLSYSASIQATRAKSKNTNLQLKKLYYNFKSVSSKILRSKTSANARQVAGAAKREVIRLKRKKYSGEYDSEELQEAITHAEAMERLAKKKARHLQEEELGKIGGKCMGAEEEKEDADKELEEALASEKGAAARDTSSDTPSEGDVTGDELQEQAEKLQQTMEAMQQFLSEKAASIEDSMEEQMMEMMEELQESMKDLMEESGLEELTDQLGMAPETDMDPADLKMMKIKHRLSEMKDLVRADAEYLRALFDRLEKSKGSSAFSLGGGSSFSASVGAAGGSSVVQVALPSATASSMAPTASAAAASVAALAPAAASTAPVSVDVSL